MKVVISSPTKENLEQAFNRSLYSTAWKLQSDGTLFNSLLNKSSNSFRWREKNGRFQIVEI